MTQLLQMLSICCHSKTVEYWTCGLTERLESSVVVFWDVWLITRQQACCWQWQRAKLVVDIEKRK